MCLYKLRFADFLAIIFFSQFPSLRWPRPRFFGEANRRGNGPQNLNYFSHCRDFTRFRKVSGRSGSKKVRFFFTPFFKKNWHTNRD